jgi:hypothetical protein
MTVMKTVEPWAVKLRDRHNIATSAAGKNMIAYQRRSAGYSGPDGTAGMTNTA